MFVISNMHLTYIKLDPWVKMNPTLNVRGREQNTHTTLNVLRKQWQMMFIRQKGTIMYI